ncbi:hypothetical protein M422DRAFT_187437 [Sphaerobolus stellatus SS14]|uniref:Insulysin n=1 Tax=Sphaerobolus stellatus (strain SS14) TaxID=990650 RepID=A0A0C9UYG8_SPHS4|nr:hypothetical protein M422DRAFT_187437 [Sphaerobolus stellatus SS14]
MNSDAWHTDPSGRYKLYDGPFHKPIQDNRQYRLLTLQNGLQAVIVHDDSAGKAAACLSVAAGFLQDPVDMPGLAHFCEHMLTKGSGLHPAENDFLSFLSSNGGARNASTGPNYTNYWFSISPGLLKETLPRLGAFFSEPLFTASVTSREINAVDSENKRNLQNDTRRLWLLHNSLSKPGHPWTKFSTGNIESLTETAKRLDKEGRLPPAEDVEGDEWWRENYCAGRMTLAVIGKASLDELTESVVQYFSSIENRNLEPRPEIGDTPWDESHTGTVIFAKTIKDVYSYSLSFLIPYQRPHYLSKPTKFLSHFIGHQGPGSLYTYLKQKGWIVSLNAAAQAWNRGIQKFEISGTLTEDGYANYHNIILSFYNYISLLKSSVFAPYHFEDVKAMTELSFRFRENSQPQAYVSWLASELSQGYPPDLLLKGSLLVSEWDESAFRQLLDCFTPDKGRLMLMAKDHPTIHPEGGWKIERWYKTSYHVQKLDPELIKQAWQPNTNPDLYLPKANPYLPDNVEVHQIDPAKAPTLIDETDRSRLWHKLDDQFWVPRAHVKIDIRSPMAYITPRHSVLTRLLANIIEDALTEMTYDAQLSGLGFAVNTFSQAFTISVSGYNDKLHLLLRAIVEKIRDMPIDPKRLAIVKEELERVWHNLSLSQPTALADSRWLSLLTPEIWSPEEKLEELDAITEKDVTRHRTDLFHRTFTEMLVNGNMSSQEAKDLLNVVQTTLTPSSKAYDTYSERSFVLPEGSNFVFRETVTDPHEVNSSLLYYCQAGPVTDEKLRATVDLIVNVIREPSFTQLRTEEQLGYIVSSYRFDSVGLLGVGIEIQSTRDPVYLEERVENFLLDFRETIQEWTDEELETQKEGLIMKQLQKVKNLSEETSHFMNHIRSGYYDFTRHEKDAANIHNITLEELVNAYDAFLSPLSASRQKLSVHMYSQTLEPMELPEGVTLIEDETWFKASLSTTPSPLPVDPLLYTPHKVSKSKL